MSTSSKGSQTRQSVHDFLNSARTSLSKAIDKDDHLALVTGNESADLDSMTSSLIYAYIRTYSRSAGAQNSSDVLIPFLPIARADLSLRPEFSALLSHADVSPQRFITLDDISRDGQLLLQPDKTRWTLVDHNALQGELGEKYGGKVVGCIDHHEDEGKVSKDAEMRVIKQAGSCTSLVVQVLRSEWDHLSSSVDGEAEEARKWDAQLAKLGIGSISIDTRNIRDEGKTKEDDREAVAYLEEKIRASRETDFDRTKFFEEVDNAKKALESLSIADILRKDYKEWKEGSVSIGVSSVVKSVDWSLEKAGSEEKGRDSSSALLSRIKEFATKRDLSVYALMTTSTDDNGQFRRELLVWALKSDVIDAVQRFEKNAKEELGLEDRSDHDDINEENDEEWRKIWWQRSVQHSRKRVAPLLREAVRG